MPRRVRMLRTYADATTILREGKVYNMSDALYATLAPLNHSGNAIFDDEPELEQGEKVLVQPPKPDPGDDGVADKKGQKAPKFTAQPPAEPAPTPAKKEAK